LAARVGLGARVGRLSALVLRERLRPDPWRRRPMVGTPGDAQRPPPAARGGALRHGRAQEPAGDPPHPRLYLSLLGAPRHVGAALALRSFLGFGAGAVAPIVFGRILDLTNAPGPFPTTWGWAFVSLGLGGLAAASCAWGLAPDHAKALRAKTTAM